MRKLILKIREILHNIFSEEHYGEIGYFSKNNPITRKYSYANWGSRVYEYYYVAKILTNIDIENKTVVDIGIGIPGDSDFYKFYIEANCFLIGIDPDQRLKPITTLSDKCKIYKQYADRINLKNESVDAVVALSSFEHFTYNDFMTAIKEVHRVLKPEGVLIVTLDTTYDKTKSAPWAILEKTLNGHPSIENNILLKDSDRQLTLELFLSLISEYFFLDNNDIANRNTEITKLVYSKKWNSLIGYLCLHKKS